MATRVTGGFTIIEVMLVLGVTGLLAGAVLVGSGLTIGQQRYRDSVYTLKSFLQQQYAEAINTTNDRTGGEGCGSTAVITAPPSVVSNPEARGTSDCLLLGRLIVGSDDGHRLTTSDIVGYRVPGDLKTNDLDELMQYTLQSSPLSQETKGVDWGSTIVKPKTTTPQPFTLVIIQGPLSGSVMTFVQAGDQSANLKTMIQSSLATQANDFDLCLQSSGPFMGHPLAVQIDRYATSQSGIEIPLENSKVCG